MFPRAPDGKMAMAFRTRSLLGLILLGAYCGLAAAAGDGVYEREAGDGVIELTNVPDGRGDYHPLVSAPVATSPTPAVSPMIPVPSAVADQVDGREGEAPPPISEGPMGAQLRSLYTGAHAAHEAQAAQGR